MRAFRYVVGASAALCVSLMSAGGALGGPVVGTTPTSEPPSSAPDATMVESSGTDAPTSAGAQTAAEPEWARIVPGGDCECADGSEFSFFVRDADPTKVVFFLEGGGACFSADTCAFSSSNATYDFDVGANDHPALMNGIFDFDREDNPFAGYSFVYVPYCTGDVHIGNKTNEYSPEVTVEHNGYVNGNTALSYLAEHFADAEQVVVVGESAGAIAAPLYGGLVSDALPEAQVTVFADGSGGYPDNPGLNAAIGNFWGTADATPDWPENEGITPEEWSFPALFVQAGTHDPDIVMARFDFAYDQTQTYFLSLVGVDDPLLASIDANEARIEGDGVDQHSFTAPGSEHTVVRQDAFYTMEVNGELLVDWLTALVNGEPVDDVHCEECGAP